MPYRSTGGWPINDCICSKTATGSGALPDTTQPGTAQRRRQLPARRRSGTTPSARRSTSCRRLRRTPAESACRCGSSVTRRAARRTYRAPVRARGTAASRAPSVSSGVHSHASASPSRSAATARARQHDTLRQPGRARGVHDQRGGLRRRLGASPIRLAADRDPRQVDLGPLRIADRRRRAGVAQHVLAFHRPGVGGHRHHGDTGDRDRPRRRSPCRVCWRARNATAGMPSSRSATAFARRASCAHDTD